MKSKKKLVPKVVSGGVAQPLGDNFYYMSGKKHKDGGIDVGTNPKTGLEVEDGEVMKLTNKEVKVFSAVPLLNGESPAKKILGGENPTKVFNAQENFKDRNGLNDDGTKKKKGNKDMIRKKALTGTKKRLNLSGIQTPGSIGLNTSNTPFTPSVLNNTQLDIGQANVEPGGTFAGNLINSGIESAGKYIKDNPWAVTDAAGLASNIVGGIIGNRANNKMLNSLEYSKEPAPRRAAKLKTRININPQLDQMRESVAAYERDIDNNTASSRVALARKQRGRVAGMLQTNELYGNKENVETQLINRDLLNQQEVNNSNIDIQNRWNEGKSNFNNTIREKKSENTIGLIETLNAGVQDVVGRSERRFGVKQNALTMAAAHPNVNPRILKEMGVKGITDEMIRNYDKTHGKNKNKGNSK